MRFLKSLALILSIITLSSPLYAGRVSTGHEPTPPLEDLPRQKTILPSPISVEETRRSYIKESAVDEQIYNRKHSVKSTCSCGGCCCGGCKRDKRYEVEPDDIRYMNNAFITAYFPRAKVWRRGTASVVTDNTMITTGHTFYFDGEYASEVIAVFGMRQVTKCGCFLGCKTLEDTARIIATRPIFAVHPDFLKDPDSSPYDIGLITFNKPTSDDFMAAGVDFSPYAPWYDQYEGAQVLSSSGNFIYGEAGGFSIGERYGVLSMGRYSSEELEGSLISITGYPIRVGRACRPLYNMYSMSGRIKRATRNLLLHDIDTSEGNSGGPVRLNSTGEIIGVHTGEYSSSYNKAVLFDSSVMDFFHQYLNAFDRAWASTNLSITVDL